MLASNVVLLFQLPEIVKIPKNKKRCHGVSNTGTGSNLGHLRDSQPPLAQERVDLLGWGGEADPAARGRQAAPELDANQYLEHTCYVNLCVIYNGFNQTCIIRAILYWPSLWSCLVYTHTWVTRSWVASSMWSRSYLARLPTSQCSQMQRNLMVSSLCDKIPAPGLRRSSSRTSLPACPPLD